MKSLTMPVEELTLVQAEKIYGLNQPKKNLVLNIIIRLGIWVILWVLLDKYFIFDNQFKRIGIGLLIGMPIQLLVDYFFLDKEESLIGLLLNKKKEKK